MPPPYGPGYNNFYSLLLYDGLILDVISRIAYSAFSIFFFHLSFWALVMRHPVVMIDRDGDDSVFSSEAKKRATNLRHNFDNC